MSMETRLESTYRSTDYYVKNKHTRLHTETNYTETRQTANVFTSYMQFYSFIYFSMTFSWCGVCFSFSALKPSLILSGEKYVELGQKISLTCTAYNGPYEHQDIDWFKDGDKLVSDSRRWEVS